MKVFLDGGRGHKAPIWYSEYSCCSSRIMNQEPRFQVNYSNLNLKLNNKIQTEKNISIKDFKSLNGGGMVQFFKQSYVRGRGGLIIKGGQLSRGYVYSLNRALSEEGIIL